ncbi:hypothetical protein PDQ79_25715 [Bacillus cereus]|nr:hypothetical protein [Bacillus cereus]
MYNNRQECWEAFWKEKVTVTGELDIEQVKQELFAYKRLLDELGLAFSQFNTSKRLSKGIRNRESAKGVDGEGEAV